MAVPIFWVITTRVSGPRTLVHRRHDCFNIGDARSVAASQSLSHPTLLVRADDEHPPQPGSSVPPISSLSSDHECWSGGSVLFSNMGHAG